MDAEEVLIRLQQLLAELEGLEEPVRGPVFEFLDGLEALHRDALHRLAGQLAVDQVATLRDGDPAVAWLLDAYGVGVDERAEVETALDDVRPYIDSHGGRLDVVGVDGGVVRVRLAGSCSGCTASAVTLREGVEKALVKGYPGFVALEVEEDGGNPHPPPGPTLLQIDDSRL